MDESRGSGVLRHQPLHDGFVAAHGSQQVFADAIGRHISDHFGPVEFVSHEFVSHLVGVHIYVVAPTEKRPCWTLVTSGMSELSMTVPPGHDISPYAELTLSLPADWPLTATAGPDDATGWPLHVLRQVARVAGVRQHIVVRDRPPDCRL
ncbi:suppressor of fused domain protein [Solwaraspora sp. WMMD406]|uniref:suppressor of fused domain protein n=1 Tax=Solwaraspora sp. WMMD406 TaxID=3016095 RepID=UPI002415C2FF|nr:suppressor of fused domain protein [Solwaraspora sp. WMMD406]MDG4767995.1 suppressor of fused domain protein [Solwaraspora sp. WMMD406]